MDKLDLILWVILILAGGVLELRGVLNPAHEWTFTALIRKWVPITIQCAVLGILFIHFPVITLLEQWGLKKP